MTAVELRRPVQRGLAPDRREPTAEGGPAEPVVRALERSLVSACHHTITSASARSPETSYRPRITTSSPASSANSFSTSAASVARSASPSGDSSRNTDHMV